ncbi:hypothetical protein [Nesterenkonia sp. K-15-9-6]|uniref:hypothetical protein n=1 Tax=Nesterenkonia sp. K-15-9-6 TaxID=3093918 RepID=UPI004044563E
MDTRTRMDAATGTDEHLCDTSPQDASDRRATPQRRLPGVSAALLLAAGVVACGGDEADADEEPDADVEAEPDTDADGADADAAEDDAGSTDGDRPADEDEAWAQLDLDTCELLTPDDLESILGVPFEEGTDDHDLASGLYAGECVWDLETDDEFALSSVDVVIFPTWQYAGEPEEWEQLKDSYDDAEEISGIGQDAFRTGSAIDIRLEGAWVTVSSMDVEEWDDDTSEEVAGIVAENWPH